MVSPRRALLSVSDKEGLVEFARGLRDLGFELIGTDGTAKTLKEAGLPVTTVADYTGLREGLGGRVKTLHPRIFAGILAPRGDEKDLEDLGAVAIDLVVANLYPFEETVAKPNVRFEEAIENIDIGGVSLIRAAAKTANRVGVVVRPARYSEGLGALRQQKTIPEKLRNELALEAFEYTSRYDAAIFNFLARRHGYVLPPALRIAYDKIADLRYGENPYQKAALYREPFPSAATATADKLQGKELSYNNLIDLDAALRIATEFERPAAVVIKHTNPSGVALGTTLVEAYEAAHAADPVSAYGGVVGLNRSVDLATAKAIKGDVLVRQGESRGAGERGGQRRVLPVPRRHRRAREGRRRGRGPAGRIDPRRRGDRRGGRAWNRDGLHRDPAVQTLRDTMARIRVGVLASGRGTDFQSLVDARKRGDLDVDLAVLVCNVPGAPVLERANTAGVSTVVVDHRAFGANREGFEREVLKVLKDKRVDLVVFAGFMRLVSLYFVSEFT